MSQNQFTDSFLKKLYLKFLDDSKNLLDNTNDYTVVCQSMCKAVREGFSKEGHLLFGMSEEDQLNVYNVLYSALYTTQFRLPEAQRTLDIHKVLCPVWVIEVESANDYCYRSASNCYHLDTLDLATNFLILDALSHHHHHVHSCLPDMGFEMLIAIGLVLLALSLIILMTYMLYLFIQMISDSIERLLFNEGMLRACMILLATAVGGFLGASVGITFATAIIIMAALSLGVSNPFSWVMLGIVTLGFLGAFTGCSISTLIANRPEEGAMNANDPRRYEITESEKKNLLLNDFNPIAVKCAIAAISDQLGEEKIPSYWFRSQEQQEYLSLVRKLRKGEVDQHFQFTATNGEVLHLDLKKAPPVATAQPVVANSDFMKSYKTHGYFGNSIPSNDAAPPSKEFHI